MPRNAGGPLPRFLAPDLNSCAAEVSLPSEEARHLTRVLRLAAGDLVSVFDGDGREFLARVGRADRAGAVLVLIEPVEPAGEPDIPFALVQAILKGRSMDDVVRDATMIGAGRIDAVVSMHIALKPSLAARPDTAERWRRIAIAAAKQSRRARVPAIAVYPSLREWLVASAAELKLLFLEPSMRHEVQPLRRLVSRAIPRDAALIVGPEGGWARAEVEAAVAAGCLPVTLGRLTLRADAVALAASTAFRVLWEDAG